MPPLPYILRLIVLRRLIWPSTCPLSSRTHLSTLLRLRPVCRTMSATETRRWWSCLTMENCSSSAERLLLGTGGDGCCSGTVVGILSRRVGRAAG